LLPLFTFFIFFQSLLGVNAERAFSQTQIDLAPIEKLSSPADFMLEDPIIPPTQGQASLASGAGSIGNALENQIALPFSDYGRPGNLAQIRGMGASASEIDVQTLGISLNPPTGSGFDLSSFPQYIWSDFTFQMGPSLNALNQSASAGTLTLTPWTVYALTDHDQKSGQKTRITESLSSGGVNQVSVGYKQGNGAAVLAGYSTGDVIGPSASTSIQWGNGTYSGRFHLLATDLDAATIGPSYARSPQARSHNTRFIPVIESDFKIGRSDLLKTSAFYDGSFVGFKDPESQLISDTYAQQWGSELSYLTQEWKFGLSLRQVSYSSPSAYGFTAPLQTLGNLQVSKEMETGSILIAPTLQGIWVTGFGLLPQGSFGIKKKWNQGELTLFSRTSFSRVLPSLMDRYGNYSEFIGNPNLLTELDWTQTLGFEAKSGPAEIKLSLYGQYRQNPRVLLGPTVTNLSDAYITGIVGTGAYRISNSLEITNTLTLTESRLLATSASFPYLPKVYDLLNLRFHSKIPLLPWDIAKKFLWELNAVLRSSSSRSTATWKPGQIPGYFVSDLLTRLYLGKSTSLFIRAENIFDRPIELIQGYPISRTFSFALVSEI
jgi:hypothetical protein